MELHNKRLDQLRLFHGGLGQQLLLRHARHLGRAPAGIPVPPISLVFGNRRDLVAPLEDSNPAELLQRRRELLGAAGHDAVQVHRVLRNFNLNIKFLIVKTSGKNFKHRAPLPGSLYPDRCS